MRPYAEGIGRNRTGFRFPKHTPARLITLHKHGQTLQKLTYAENIERITPDITEALNANADILHLKPAMNLPDRL
ncbi:MAG: hypothetical protein IJ268_05210 [Proteobacteria bacterium]|nr:hypothetical protein [Pseudomonadota bacterium]